MRRYWTAVLIIVFFLVPVLLMGLTSNGDPETGKAVFLKRCKMCHGVDGNGYPAMARMLGVEFKAMSSDHVQDLSDDTIRETVLKGKGKMAKVRKVTDQDITHVIAYLRTLKK